MGHKACLNSPRGLSFLTWHYIKSALVATCELCQHYGIPKPKGARRGMSLHGSPPYKNSYEMLVRRIGVLHSYILHYLFLATKRGVFM